MQPYYAFSIEPKKAIEAAVREADLIVTATSSSEPVVRREWIASGAHLNVVGASQPDAREIDTATMAAASLFVDRRESTLNESGDYLQAARESAIGPEHIRAEIGEVVRVSRVVDAAAQSRVGCGHGQRAGGDRAGAALSIDHRHRSQRAADRTGAAARARAVSRGHG